MMNRFYSWPIRVHVIILIALLAVPCVSLIVYSGIAARYEAMADAKNECSKLVNDIAGQEQALVASAEQLATALSLLPPIQSRNPTATSALFSDLLRKNPQYANISVCDKSGLVWASATPLEGKVSVADRKSFVEAVRTGMFSSGEYSMGRIVKKPVINFGYPVKNTTNEVIAVISIVLDLDYSQHMFEKFNLPPGSLLALLDHRGIIIIRNVNDSKQDLSAGRDPQRELFTRMTEGPDEGTFEARGNDDKPRLVAYKKISLSGESKPYLYIRAGIPLASATSKANAALFRNLSVFLSLFLIGSLLAWLVGKRIIVNPVTMLKGAAEQLAAGADTINVSDVVKGSELGKLARAFDGMAEALIKEKTALRESEQRWATTLASIGDAVIATDVEGKITFMNATAEGLTGWMLGEASMKPVTEVLHIINKHSRSEAESLVAKVLRQGIIVGLANQGVLALKDGTEVPICFSGAPIRNTEGKTMGVVLVFRDITERRRAEEALRESEERLRALMDAAPVAISWSDMEGDRKYINRRHYELFGYTLEDIPTKAEFHRRAYPDPAHRETIPSFIDASKQGEELAPYEATIACKDGTQRHVIVSATVVLNMLLIMFNDITERKRAEEALRASEEKYRSLVEGSSDAIFMVDTQRTITSCNHAFLDLFGYEKEEVENRSVRLIHASDASFGLYGQKAYPAIQKQGTFRAECDFVRKDGTTVHVESVNSAVKGPDGSIKGFVGIIRDMSERKKAEQALKESEERYRLLFNSGNDVILVHGIREDGGPATFIEANEVACRRLGYTRAELLAMSPADLDLPEHSASAKKLVGELMAEKHVLFEMVHRTKGGGEVPVEISAHLFGMDGSPTILSICRDITERKRAEERIRASLQEKEVLLKEIHHRVKNNLQIISSLLFLQATRTEHPTVLSALEESRNRIKSMALIHERLYQSSDFASVDMGEYTRNLVSDLRRSHMGEDGLVRLTLNLESIPFHITEAIPCGLIINELISNALKHAFPKGKEGEITIRLQRGTTNQITLTVSDNGIGFPAHVDFRRSPSLGLTLINSLVEQLEGAIELDQRGGSTFTITFNGSR